MKTIKIGEKEIVVREISYKKIREWLIDEDQILNNEFDFVLDAVLTEGLTIRDICRLCDLSHADAEEMLPSDLAKIALACKEVNSISNFFQIRDHVKFMAQKNMLQEKP